MSQVLTPFQNKANPPPPRFTEFKQRVYKTYIRAPHLDLLDNYLTQLSLYVDTQGKRGIGRLIVEMPPRHGKCLGRGTLVTCANGERKPIEAVDIGDYVVSMGEGFNPTQSRVTSTFVLGEKSAYRVRLFSGREIVCASTHPFMTIYGWQELGSLKKGDSLAAYHHVNTTDGDKLPEGHASLLGYVVGDGSFAPSSGGTLVASIDEDVLNHIRRLLAVYKWELIRVNNTPNYRLINPVIGGKRIDRDNPTRMLQSYMPRAKSGDKRIPPAIFTASRQDIADFLGAYFNCDGSVSANRAGLAEYYSISKSLLLDTQHLLLRFGIYSDLRRKMGRYKGEPHSSWRLSIVGQDLMRMAECIPVVGVKGVKLKQVALQCSEKNHYPEYDAIPNGWQQFLTIGKGTLRLRYGIRVDKHYKRGTARHIVAQIAGINDNHALKQLCNPHIVWDRIVEIEPIGDMEMFDIEVEDTHNYCVEGILSHNSTTISRLYPAWHLGLRPDHRIMLASYAADLAERHSRKSRDILSYATYKTMFPQVKLNPREQAASSWGILGREGGMDALGLLGGASGKGAQILIIDDAVKNRQEAESKLIRDRQWEGFQDDLLTRLEPFGAAIIVMTRWHCLFPDCDIMTDMGIQQIKTITSGQSVLTSRGLQKVQAVASKPYEGDLIGVRVYGYPEPLRVTPEHRLLTVNGWRKAGTLRAGDWMKFPIPIGETTIEELRSKIPDAPVSQAAGQVRRTGARSPVVREQIETLLATGKTYQQIADELGYKSKQSVYEYASLYGLNRPVERPISGNPTDDADFWRVVGYWLAEGSLSSGRKGGKRNVIRFTFSLKEQHFVDDVREVLGRYGVTVTQQTRKATLLAHCSSAQIGALLTQFGLGAHHKFLPEWAVLLPKPFAQQLVKGYLEGDGTEHDGWERITSVSLDLLIGIQRVLMRLGVVGSIMAGMLGKYELRFPLSTAPWVGYDAREVISRFSRIEGDYLVARVKSIEVEPYNGLVYDLQTPCHDFLGHGMTIHNCDDLVGRILSMEGDKWTRLRLPAFAEENDPLGREVGAALWPERFSVEELTLKRDSMGEYSWASLYQQRPAPSEGGIFKIELLGEGVSRLPNIVATVRYWDLAMSERTGADYTVGAKLGLGDDGHFYILDVVRRRVDWSKLPDFMAMTMLVDGPSVSQGIEQKGYMSRAITELNVDPRLHDFRIFGYPKEIDKLTSALPFAGRLGAGAVHMVTASWNDAFKDELAAFPYGEHDDQVDAVCGAYNMFAPSESAGTLRIGDMSPVDGGRY